MSRAASDLRRRPRSTKGTLRSHPRNSLPSWSFGVRKYPALILLAKKPSPGKVPQFTGFRGSQPRGNTGGSGRGFDSVLTKTGRRLMMIGGLCGYPWPHTPITVLAHPQAQGNTWCAGPRDFRGEPPSVRPSAGSENRDSGAGDRSNWPGKPQSSSQARVMFLRAGHCSRMQLRRT